MKWNEAELLRFVLDSQIPSDKLIIVPKELWSLRKVGKQSFKDEWRQGRKYHKEQCLSEQLAL
jgi:hypothetical protein